MKDDQRSRPGGSAADPAAGPPFEVAGLSREGRRSSNEDSAAWAVFGPDASVAAYAVVCDGMGGHNAGEVASSMALRALRDRVAQLAADPSAFADAAVLRDRLTDWIEQVNREIHDVGVKNPEQRGMGTTLAAALTAPDGRLVVANVGDSKIFVLRGVVVHQVSVDHTALAEQRRVLGMDGVAPEDVSGNPFAHALTRSIGQEKSVQPEVRTDLFLDRGDLAILTSDGVTDVLESERFLSIVEHSKSLGEICESIYRQAYEAGSKDNITVTLIARGRPSRLGASADRPRVVEEGEDPFDATRPLQRAPAVPVTSGESLAGGPPSAAPEPPRGAAPPPRAYVVQKERRLQKTLVLAGGALAVAVVAAVLALVLSPSTPTAEPTPTPPPAPLPTTAPVVRLPSPVPTQAPAPAPTVRFEEVPLPAEAPTRPPAAIPTVAVAVLPGGAVQKVAPTRPARPAPTRPEAVIPPVGFARPAAATPAPPPAAAPTAVPTRAAEVTTISVPTAAPPVSTEEPVPIREARLERAHVRAESRFYSFHFSFDRPVRLPRQGESLFPKSITVTSRRGDRLDAAGVPLRYQRAEGRTLIYRLETSRTNFAEKKLLGDGDSVLIDFGDESPFSKTRITADVFTK
ncbi:MAG: hypothetical protein EDX89_08350 [Acidobacteria bacterium]|nr:MAG: hypothetical protein EDX89_08350 [Acidobacteriota bacterium]